MKNSGTSGGTTGRLPAEEAREGTPEPDAGAWGPAVEGEAVVAVPGAGAGARLPGR